MHVTLKGNFGVKKVSPSDNKWTDWEIRVLKRESFTYSAIRKKSEKDRRELSEDK